MNIKILTALISRATGNFATKTLGEAFHISGSNRKNTNGFNIDFKVVFYPYLHLVCFISNAVKIRLVYEFSTFHGRCLILLLNSAQNFDSRCLFSQLERSFFSDECKFCVIFVIQTINLLVPNSNYIQSFKKYKEGFCCLQISTYSENK